MDSRSSHGDLLCFPNALGNHKNSGQPNETACQLTLMHFRLKYSLSERLGKQILHLISFSSIVKTKQFRRKRVLFFPKILLFVALSRKK
uniref:Uncharacterized protein n=1 Tax=Candidatus Kentrum sp. TUN TaxID=2126343 RepID=A0A450ZSD8_9GAMM|nr:MAG: hypothetical protein BECKTUN1418D_GA0071000_105114 [Candidatus Kentron sp. TUN]